MIVKIRDKIYSDQETPIMIILSPQDIEAIKRMGPDNTKRFCSFPAGMDKDKIFKWMDGKKDG